MAFLKKPSYRNYHNIDLAQIYGGSTVFWKRYKTRLVSNLQNFWAPIGTDQSPDVLITPMMEVIEDISFGIYTGEYNCSVIDNKITIGVDIGTSVPEIITVDFNDVFRWNS